MPSKRQLPDLRLAQHRAEIVGRRCVVAALITDEIGRVFVHRRGPQRAFLPGGWDLPGGHVEPGETLLEALAREVREETGWRLVGSPQLVHVADWWTDPRDPASGRREFDFLVDVEGDFDRPRLEWPEHVEIGWIGPADLDRLDENQGRDDGIVRHAVELAHRHTQASRAGYPHVGTFLSEDLAAIIEPLREEWDPAMAGQIAAHVTLAYPQEVGDTALAIDRVRGAASTTRAFSLRLGKLEYSAAPATVFVRVADPDGGWQRLRGALAPDRPPTRIGPHVTIVHPRTSNLADQAWQAVEGTSIDAEHVVREVSVAEYQRGELVTVASFALR